MSWETTSAANFPWNEVTLFASEIDVRNQIATLLNRRGHSVFVRKRTEKRCSCWTGKQYDESNYFCSRCDGYGWIYMDYEYKSRRRPAFGTYGFAPKVTAAFGDIEAGDSIFYFKHSDTISEAYKILEVTIDSKGAAEKPYRIERVHDVKLAHAYRDQYGRIEYWAALTREHGAGK